MKTDQIYDLYRECAGVSTDSRTVKKNEIFFALWGDNFNGNLYAAEALEKGASWAVIDDPMFETDRTILVDDCLNELQALATHHRKMMNVPVLAIVGSNGKTTTKELLATIMAKKHKVHYTRGNLNNHIGVPLTILSAPQGTDFMIIEMGANHIGEIRNLCTIARPDYGILTNIGMAHIEGFGSFEGVVKAKTELYEYLRKVNGVALYNDKNPLLAEKIFRIVNRAVPFSDPTGIELQLELMASDLNLVVKAVYQNKEYVINTNLFGEYNYENIKAAIGAGLFFDVPMHDVADAVESYVPENNRSQVKKTKNNTVICDSYNANPTSMHSSLSSFSGLKASRKLVILGDMLELGEKSEDEHRKILKELESCRFGSVYLVGPIFKKITSGHRFRAFASVSELSEHLAKNPVKGYTVLVKGSRGIGLEKVYPML